MKACLDDLLRSLESRNYAVMPEVKPFGNLVNIAPSMNVYDEVFAANERKGVNDVHTGWDCDALQAAAVPERELANADHIVRDRDVSQTTTPMRLSSDGLTSADSFSNRSPSDFLAEIVNDISG